MPANSQPPKANSSLRTTALTVLPILSLFGAFVTWGLGFSNGTFNSITDIITHPSSSFPGTESPLLRTYTGLNPIDYQLSVLVTFFAPVLDGSDKNLTVFVIMTAGQFGGVWLLMMIEGLRIGNRGKLISYVGTFGLIIQNISYAITAPIYIFLHLLTSPIIPTKQSIQVSSLDISILPHSWFLGYIVPSILMALPSPSIVSLDVHQKSIALWQLFPLLTVLIHTLLRTIISPFVKSESKLPASPRKIYNLVLWFTTLTHAPLVIYSAYNQIASAVVSPAFPDLRHSITSLVEGVHIFLKWDIAMGGIAFLIWSIVGWWNAKGQKGEGRWMLLPKMSAVGMSSGVVGVCALLLRERDAALEGKVGRKDE